MADITVRCIGLRFLTTDTVGCQWSSMLAGMSRV